MKEPVVRVTEITHAQWLAARRTGIGGSDASTVVGLNPYSSLFYLYNDKLGLLPEKEDSEAMRQGRDLEQYVAERWMERTGKRCRRNNTMWRSAEHPYMLADIDREVVGENAGLECKTTSVYNRTDFEAGNISPTYYVQCMHYMAVMGYDRMYLAVLVLNSGFYDFVIERDEAEIAALTEQEASFWRRVIEHDPPPPDGSEATRDALQKLYPRERPQEYAMQLFGQLCDSALAEWNELQNTIRDLKAIAAEKKAIVMAEMGEAPLAETDGYTIRWRTQSRVKIDAQALKRDHPEIYREYIKTTQTRVFRAQKKREVDET